MGFWQKPFRQVEVLRSPYAFSLFEAFNAYNRKVREARRSFFF